MNTRSSIPVLSIVLLLVAAPLLAGADEPPQRTVRFSANDVATEAGIGALYGRIQRASREVCDSLNTHTPGARIIADRCQAEATARAITDLNLPALTRYHGVRSKQPTLMVRR